MTHKIGDTWYYVWFDPQGQSILFVSGSVTKVTPKGVVIDGYKLIIHSWQKKYMYPTKQQALESFKIRRSKQIKILTACLEEQKTALNVAINHVLKEEDFNANLN